jgi:hypothetical protein
VTSPAGLGHLLDRAFRLYRARPAPLLLIAAVFLVPLGLVNGWLTGSVVTGYLQILQELATRPEAPPEDMLRTLDSASPGLGVLLLLVLGTVLVNGLTTTALVSCCFALLRGGHGGLWRAAATGFARLPAYVGMVLTQGCMGALAMGLFIVPGMAVLFVLILLLGAVLAAPGESLGAVQAILMAVTVFLAVLVYAFIFSPLLYLAARWVVAIPSLVEWRGPWQALRRSWRLTQGQVWRSLAYVTLLWIMGQSVMFALGLMLQLPLLLLVPESVAGVVAGVAASVGRVLWQPIYAAALVMYFLDLQARRESPALLAGVVALEQEVAQQAQPAPGPAGGTTSPGLSLPADATPADGGP